MELQELVKRCIRIIHISRKPTAAEFNKVARVTALGMLIFGVIGFVISIVSSLVR